MSISKIQQTQIRGSLSFDDGLPAGADLAGKSTVKGDLDALRSQMKRIIGKDAWYAELDGLQDLADIYAAVHMTGSDADFQGEISSVSHASIGGDLSVAAAASIGGDLGVTGDSTFAGDAIIAGAVNIGGGYGSGGVSVDMDGNVSMNGNLIVDANVTLGNASTDLITFNAKAAGELNMNSHKIVGLAQAGAPGDALAFGMDAFVSDLIVTGGHFTVEADGDTNIAGTLDVGGAVNFSSTLQAGATSLDELAVSGTSTLTGAVTAAAGLTVSSGGASITGGAAVTGDLTVSEDAAIMGDVAVTGDADFAGDMAVVGEMEVTGAVQLLSSLAVAGSSTLAGLSAGASNLSSLSVSGNSSLAGNAGVGGALNVAGSSTLAGLSAGASSLSSLAVSGNSTFAGAISGGNGLTISAGSTSVQSLSATSAAVGGNASVAGNLGVGGGATFSSTLQAGATSVVSLAVANAADFNGGVTANAVSIDGDVAQRLYIVDANGSMKDESALVFDGSDLSIDGGLVVSGDAQIDGDLLVKGSFTYIETENMRVKDSFIYLATGSNGALDSGVVFSKGAGAAYDLVVGQDGGAGELVFAQVAHNSSGDQPADLNAATLVPAWMSQTKIGAQEGSMVGSISKSGDDFLVSSVAASELLLQSAGNDPISFASAAQAPDPSFSATTIVGMLNELRSDLDSASAGGNLLKQAFLGTDVSAGGVLDFSSLGSLSSANHKLVDVFVNGVLMAPVHDLPGITTTSVTFEPSYSFIADDVITVIIRG
jgi:predicted acyltransferase (DUF342 family)